MKNTIKTLYNIDAKALIKYTNKVYKVKSLDECEYCLKYVDNISNSTLIEKINALNLNNSFVMPIKTCIRTQIAKKEDKLFYLAPWVEDDNIESKELKIKYYLLQLGKMHAKSSYTLNVTQSFFSELTMNLEELIEESYQQYEKIIKIIERKEYKSPFEWYFINHFNQIIDSLDKSRTHLTSFKNITKDKASLRQVIIHQNFSYDHVFITKDKIIGNDKMKLASPVYDLKDLFEKVTFGSIDISGMINEYLKNIELEDYEKEWLLSLLFIVPKLNIIENDIKNLKNMMNILFKYKSICELEEKIGKKNSD